MNFVQLPKINQSILHYLEEYNAAMDEPQPTSTQEAVVASWILGFLLQ